MKTRYNDISFEKARSDPDCWGIWKTKEKMKHRIGLITYSSGEMEIKLTWKDVTPKIFNTMNFFLQQLNLNEKKVVDLTHVYNKLEQLDEEMFDI